MRSPDMRRHAFLRVARGRIAGPAALLLCAWLGWAADAERGSRSADLRSGAASNIAQTTAGRRPALLAARISDSAATNLWKPNFPDTALVPLGRFVFERNCAVCHGRLGDGWGELSRSLTPRPRDFTRGYFKFRSTPSGSLPTDADLRRTIREGLAGTAMPIFDQMEERDVRAVTEFIKSLSPRWQQRTNYAPPVVLPERQTWFDQAEPLKAQAEKGRQSYNQMCIACHGEDGSGNGPGAADLEDNWHRAIRPADLRKPSIRRGREPEEIVRILLTGMDGTPMISFAELTTEEQRWQLAAYVLQLRKTAEVPPK